MDRDQNLIIIILKPFCACALKTIKLFLTKCSSKCFWRRNTLFQYSQLTQPLPSSHVHSQKSKLYLTVPVFVGRWKRAHNGMVNEFACLPPLMAFSFGSNSWLPAGVKKFDISLNEIAMKEWKHRFWRGEGGVKSKDAHASSFASTP